MIVGALLENDVVYVGDEADRRMAIKVAEKFDQVRGTIKKHGVEAVVAECNSKKTDCQTVINEKLAQFLPDRQHTRNQRVRDLQSDAINWQANFRRGKYTILKLHG